MDGSTSSGDVPSLGRRQLLNLLSFGAVTGVAAGAIYPIARFFAPPRTGNTVSATGWLAGHKPGDRSLAQELKGDPTYLIVEGSEAIGNGKVVRGPAPLSLALAHVDNDNDQVVLRPWTETDFRDGSNPWWTT